MDAFAGIEATLNRAATGALGNARAQWRGVILGGVFDLAYRDGLGIVSNAPRFTCPDTGLDDLVPGDTLRVTYRGTVATYTVREIQPDGTGLLVLIIEAA